MTENKENYWKEKYADIHIRLTNRIAELEQENKELNEKYTHVLELAKTNADSNEYCLQELEKENKELKKRFEKRGELMCNCAKQREKYKSALEEIRTYLNTLSSIDSDFTSTETYLRIQNRINEVLE